MPTSEVGFGVQQDCVFRVQGVGWFSNTSASAAAARSRGSNAKRANRRCAFCCASTEAARRPEYAAGYIRAWQKESL